MKSRAGHVVLRDARELVVDSHPRSNDGVITQKLESVWPFVSDRLMGMLRKRGVSPHDADEAIQETAARAICAGIEFTDADDLLRWASVVSWRIAIDARRRCARLSTDDVPERADHIDVAQAAEHRIVLSAVTSRFKELSERDRAVLLASFEDQSTPSRLEAVRAAVARHRARDRLRGMLNGLAAPVFAFVARRRWRSANAEALVSTAAPALACFALTIVGVGPNPPMADRRAAVVVPSVSVTTSPGAEAASPTEPLMVAISPEPSPARIPSPTLVTAVHLESSGHTTDVGTRPREESDHVACVTLPSLAGPARTCVDPPSVPGP